MFFFFKRQPARLFLPPEELHAALRSQLGAHMAGNCTIRLADNVRYASVKGEEARGFVASAASFWTPEVNDCDDQAWMAKAAAIKAQMKVGSPLAFGVVWTEDHALNWHCDEFGKIRLIDQPGASDRLTLITLILG